MSTFLSIKMESPETRVYLNPALSVIREIQLLDFHSSKVWFRFKTQQVVYKFGLDSLDNYDSKQARGSVITNIPSDDYTLKTLQQAFVKGHFGPGEPNIEIRMTDHGNFMISKFHVILTEKLYRKMGVPEVLIGGKLYPITWIPDRPLNLYCDIIESHRSYTNLSNMAGGDVKLVPSILLAVVPSQNYPSIPVRQNNYPINYFTLLILDEKGRKPNFNGEPISISLKVSH